MSTVIARLQKYSHSLGDWVTTNRSRLGCCLYKLSKLLEDAGKAFTSVLQVLLMRANHSLQKPYLNLLDAINCSLPFDNILYQYLTPINVLQDYSYEKCKSTKGVTTYCNRWRKCSKHKGHCLDQRVKSGDLNHFCLYNFLLQIPRNTDLFGCTVNR